MVKREQTDKDFLMRALFEIKTDLMDVKDRLNELGLKISEEKDDNHKDNFTGNSIVISSDELEEMNYEEIEKRILLFLLKEKNWDKNEVARILNQTPRNVYKKINKYNLKK